MKSFLYKSFSKVGGDKLLWTLDGKRLRILCYHGICEDRLAGEPWMPSYFTAQSAFDRHLAYLRENAAVLPLTQAAELLRKRELPPRCVCLTFDDGYANNLELALPLLKKYGLPATIFLSTANIESGEFYPFLKLKLIGLESRAALPEYKTNPLSRVLAEADRFWPVVEPRLTDDQNRTLRPMTVAELRGVTSTLLDFGGHNHHHCILRNESAADRENEIRTSIRKVAEWTGRRVRTFSYPNGEHGDFGQADKEVLRQEGIEAAVTGMAGANGYGADLFELRRYPITLGHDAGEFSAEVTGLRTAVLSAAGRPRS